MGYHTEFSGQFDLDRPLAPEHREYLAKFAETRRMKRDAAATETRPDPIRQAVGLPVGEGGGYFVGALGDFGQEDSGVPGLLDYNNPPSGQPGLWCNWAPNADGTAIEWNGAEKFYYYTEWLAYIIKHFLEPWGYKISGQVTWQGEEHGDHGIIAIHDNKGV